MSVTREYLDYVIDQLSEFGSVDAKRMFGGAGLYHNGVFFGLVADDVVYFKVDDARKPAYIEAGSAPFRPFGSYAMGYYEVPVDVLEDPGELAVWARKAHDAALQAKNTGVHRTKKKRRSH